MLVTVAGLALVGISSVLKPSSGVLSDSNSQAVLGVFLVLVGSLATALQMTVEEIFLKKRNYHPLHVVGMEGLYGTTIMGFVS